MLKFQAQIYKINDILGWDEKKELVLTPYFQRRRVWGPSGKSYLMDSIINGYPLPQIFIREKLNLKDRKTIREVVDGQQRLRTILEFINGEFTILPVHNPEYAKKKFTELPEGVQEDILTYPLSVNVLTGSEDADVLGIFSRINAYAVPLNAQEKLNAKYLGDFKQNMDRLSKLHLAYWEDNKILTKSQMARMKEVEFTAELISSMLGGLQDGKAIIAAMYRKYDSAFPQISYLGPRFGDTLELCKAVIGGAIAETEFSRTPLFYSLFCAVYDCKYGLGSAAKKSPKKQNNNALEGVRQKLYQLNESITGEEKYPEFKDFVKASRSSTDKINSRTTRHNALKKILERLFVHA